MMPKLLVIALLISIPAVLPAALILSVADGGTAPPPIGAAISSTQALAASWTQPGAFSNVSITAPVATGVSTGTIRAFLTTQLGAGTTQVSHEIASATVPTTLQTSPYPFITIFSGLTLGPGTYYLSMFRDTGANTNWNADFPATVTSDVGATLAVGLMTAGSPFDATYLPASSFGVVLSSPLLFQVTGDSPVPEPSTVVLVAGGILALALRRR